MTLTKTNVVQSKNSGKLAKRSLQLLSKNVKRLLIQSNHCKQNSYTEEEMNFNKTTGPQRIFYNL